MDTYGAEGFFPGREVLRARRLRAMAHVPLERSEARTRRMGAWVAVSVAVFTPMFVNAVVFGWITYRSSLEVLVCAISCVLAGASALAAVKLRRAFRRAKNPLS